MIYNLGQECNARFDGHQCNSYLITGAQNIIVDTIPREYEREYISVMEKYISPQNISALILTDAIPEKSGCVEKLLEYNPDMVVYASVAGLRNLNEIVNKQFCRHMCKNEEIVLIGDKEFQFFITPNLPNPDTIMAHSKTDNVLFSGYMYMCDADGISAVYYNKFMSVLPFIKNVHTLIKEISPKRVYSSVGNNIVDFAAILPFYDDLCTTEVRGEDFILIAYASESGSNQKLAHAAQKSFDELGIKSKTVSLRDMNTETAANMVGKAVGLVLGTYTRSRSLPQCVWDFLSKIDVNSVSKKPYFVFSSYGWSGEGAYISNELLTLLKMRKVCKSIECVFTPNGDDYKNISKAARLMIEMLKKEREDGDA